MKIIKYLSYTLLAAGLIFSGCSKDNSSAPATGMSGNANTDPSTGNNSGKGGSMARFAISNNHLYTVDRNNIKIFDISTPNTATLRGNQTVGNDIETIFPRGNELFIGSMSGMYIYDISVPSNPQMLSNYRHIVACDPVVADGDYAYVTLRNVQNRCGGRSENQLEVINIEELRNPRLEKIYPMTAPKGLGKDGNKLFVCDDGVKVFDASDPLDLKLLNQYTVEATDLIPYNGVLMIIGFDGLYQYKYDQNSNELELLSKLPVTPTL